MVLSLLLTSAFLYWVVGTPQGTRWALVTAVHYLDGEIKGVSGTVWGGVDIAHLAVKLPSVEVSLDQAKLHVNWRELEQRRLHVRELSAQAARIHIISTPDPEPAQPFAMPQLPVTVALDHFAVNQLELLQDGQPLLPADVGQVSAALALNNAGGQVLIQSLALQQQELHLDLQGDIRVLGLADPWPFTADLSLHARGDSADSALCARSYLPSLPQAAVVVAPSDAGATNAPVDPDVPSVADATAGASDPALAMCSVDLTTTASGSLDHISLQLTGSGQDMDLQAKAQIKPRDGFPLQSADVALRLPDGSALHSQLQHETLRVDGEVQDRIHGWLRSEHLDVGQLAGSVIPPATLTARADFDVSLHKLSELVSADVSLEFAKGSSWNNQALEGMLKAQVIQPPITADAPVVAPSSLWQTLHITALDTDLQLGSNHIKGKGSLGSGDSQLSLDITAPELAAFWPELPGGVAVQGDISGAVSQHRLDMTAVYTPKDSQADQVGSAPAQVHVVMAGGWGSGSGPEDALIGWRGQVGKLDLAHAKLAIHSDSDIALRFVPDAVAPDWQWQVGAAQVAVAMDSRPLVILNHAGSRGAAGRWETQGAIDQLAVSRRLIDDVLQLFSIEQQEKADRGSVRLPNEKTDEQQAIVFAANWDLAFDQALTGTAHIARLSGDVVVPTEPPVPLGLKELTLDVSAVKSGGATSTVKATLDVQTEQMGRISATASTVVHAAPGGGIAIDPKDLKTVSVNAAIDDLSWTSLFLDDSMELGGAVNADVELQSRQDGSWKTSGLITGEGIKVLRIDDGVRLLDGTLSAHLADDTLILDRLYFPARLRAVPKEWRTAEWVSTNPEAQGGGLTLTGQWNLFDSAGHVDVDLYRYPVLQRADRYAMVSGKLQLQAELPAIGITGSIVADAGWFDLDMLGGIPTVDGDVVVIRAGDQLKEPDVPMQISMDLEVGLGPRFYLTGYGVNSGLVGQLRVQMVNNKLSGIGALRTRGGAIEAYGQRLQLRRGTVTFQGDITSPVLDIEALRTGLAVEAGVKVAGTAKRPRIDLVSYPDVSEIEKLSWLLLGHGPDESGGDIALLLSAGTSFLGAGEPFYRKFGIDEVSMRSGELGSAGSVLPVESVVSGLDSGTSDIERRFVMVSKGFSDRLALSIRQALSDTGTVGHASYRLMRNLTAELSVGTVNGLALVYRWFSGG